MLGSPVTHSSPHPLCFQLSTVEANGAPYLRYQVDHISAANVDNPVVSQLGGRKSQSGLQAGV